MLTGTLIGYQLDQATQKNRIFFVEAATGYREWATSGSDDCITPSWKDDGTEAFVYSLIAADNTPWITTNKGKRMGPGIHPAYSPDGKKFIFTTLPTGSSRSEIAVMNIDGSDQRMLTTTTAADRTGHIQSLYGTFSPDGVRIVYASSQSGSLQIWTMAADGSDKRQLTGLPRGSDALKDANAPAWSPDGSRVAYFAGKEGDKGTINVHDGLKYRSLLLGSPTTNIDNPAWSPDGEWIAFESDRPAPGETADPHTHRNRTWVMRSDGTEAPLILLPYGYGAGRQPWK